MPGYFDAVYIVGAFFDAGEQAVANFWSGVNRYAHAQKMDHQHGQAFNEKQLEKNCSTLAKF